MDERNFTKHAKSRAKERINTQNIDRQFTLALERGITSEQATNSKMKRYLKNRTNETSYAIMYNNICFIVARDNNVCITAYVVPANFQHEKRIYYNGTKISSRRSKNYYKKNSEFYGDADDEKYIKEICKHYTK